MTYYHFRNSYQVDHCWGVRQFRSFGINLSTMRSPERRVMLAHLVVVKRLE